MKYLCGIHEQRKYLNAMSWRNIFSKFMLSLCNDALLLQYIRQLQHERSTGKLINLKQKEKKEKLELLSNYSRHLEPFVKNFIQDIVNMFKLLASVVPSELYQASIVNQVAAALNSLLSCLVSH